jgi:EAL domain-containing protein (putative c-di-GMP-specific phosphodiesterase class I)
LKIDRSFVNELGGVADEQGRALVRSIITIGHNLNVLVIAEGIEHENQLDELVGAGCDFGQGYFFGRPTPPDEIPELLARHRHPGAPSVAITSPKPRRKLSPSGGTRA